MTDEMTIRPAEPADAAGIIELLRVSLGKGSDPRYEGFFRWKHEQNPFGPSPAWVAESDGLLVGFRTFMRWEFVRNGRVVKAVRAVDTATAPAFRGRGVFSRLTKHALSDLRAEGVELIFNTPNDQSRPGYLKMGWQLVGRLPVAVRPRSPASARSILRARGAARLWSEPTNAGDSVDSLSGAPGVGLAGKGGQEAPRDALVTRTSPEYLAWRFGFGPLHYRVLSQDGGAMVLRVRRRESAKEMVVAAVMGDGPATRRRLVRAGLHTTGADYAIMLGKPGWGTVPAPRVGPTLTCLPLDLADVPPLDRWALQMGDVELF